jgi:hypothetical protein
MERQRQVLTIIRCHGFVHALQQLSEAEANTAMLQLSADTPDVPDSVT